MAKAQKLRLTQKLVDALEPQAGMYVVKDTELSGFELRISPGGRKAFSLLYRTADGKQRRLGLGAVPMKNVSGARRDAIRALAAVSEGRDPAGERKAARQERKANPTLAEFVAQQYRPYMCERHKGGERVCDMLDRFPEHIRNAKLKDITRDKIERFATDRLKAGRTIATVNRYQSHLKAALSRAAEWGLLDENPLAGLKNRSEKGRERVRYLDDNEEQLLLRLLDEREERRRAERVRMNEWRLARHMEPLPPRDGHFTDWFKPFVLAALHTGMRKGELLSLTWKDIDLGDGVIRVRAANTKSNRPREVPINATLHDVLTRWHAQTGGEGYVFAGRDGGEQVDAKRPWINLLTRKEPDGTVSELLPNFRFHDLRHTFASKLVQRGVDLFVVSKLLGHSNVLITQEHYAHLAPHNLSAAVRKLDVDDDRGQLIDLDARRKSKG